MAKHKGFSAVYVGTGKVHLTADNTGDDYVGSLCGRLPLDRGFNFFVDFEPETGCGHCAKEAERRTT